MAQCKQCRTGFEITDADRKVYARFQVSEPTLCPLCRQQRRLAFRNEHHLYHRQCGLCKKPIVSLYSPEKPFPVYCSDCFWSDRWDPLSYGQDLPTGQAGFDFNRPFFPQFQELQHKVPLLTNAVFNSVNCEYNSFCSDSKDCYQSSRLGDSEKIFYSYLVLHSERCVDCYNVSHSQDCYECIDTLDSNHCLFSQLVKSSSDCVFCFDCIGCHNCFGCVGLRNKDYYFFNQKCTKAQYEQYLEQYFSGPRADIQKIRQRFYQEEILKRPHRAAVVLNSENAVGNYIFDSKNAYQCFDMERVEDARYTWGGEFGRDLYDCDFIYYGENCYENISNAKSQNILFTFAALNANSDLAYCLLCFNNNKNCFGSISLKHQEYCILNKKYSKEEYFRLRDKLIDHMTQKGEYGEFFPITLSPFAYNETFANYFFPLPKEEVLKKGWNWKEEDKKEYKKQTAKIPSSIKEVKDDILETVLACSDCGKNYKIVKQELDFYRTHNLMVPFFCPACRHRKRLALRNPYKLFDRNCAKCKTKIQTTYPPDRPEIVYCENCYLKEVY